ncbi:TIGR04222 domain-containing membrane protein [Streptomyces sp. NRRL S-340]|uniref:TIGR04222 domain-containing membrane protein n=1 Tax=Streptomyces sp. NRRL S-340 TaxID=1463901 RepID=UPI000562CDDD|nr:TIGR04222 domain-containing membrane protein [Streptomyces sp. NRRL S-340]
MDAPWGFTGPEFLGVYAAGFVVAVLLGVAVRKAARRFRPATETALAPDVYTIAWIVGGARQMANTAVFALIQRGHLRRALDGTLTFCGGLPDEPVQRAVLEAARTQGATSTPLVHEAARQLPEIRRAGEAARRLGLLPSRRRRLAGRLAGLPMLVLTGVGIARVVNGVRLGRPVGWLVMFLLVSLVVAAVFVCTPPRITPAGWYAVRNSGRSSHPVHWGPAGDGPKVPASIVAVAMAGWINIPDPTLGSSLFSGFSSSSSSSSSSSGGGWGGSSCGGGGCGGGGGGCGG